MYCCVRVHSRNIEYLAVSFRRSSDLFHKDLKVATKLFESLEKVGSDLTGVYGRTSPAIIRKQWERSSKHYRTV